MFLWIAFIICTSVIVYSGSKLSRYGDVIAEKTGMGRTWIGLILIASVTSLPELITGISSVTYVDVPNIAVGDVLGSCVFNMLIFSLLDFFHRRMPITTKAHYSNILYGVIGILLLSIVSISIYVGDNIASLLWIGLYTPLLGLIYFIAMRLIFKYEKRQIATYIKEVAIEMKYKDISKKKAFVNYCINAVIVIIAAILLPKIGEGIAVISELGQTFVGNIFIAISTSLPELVVSMSALKIDAVDLAIGNLFGSNIFNIFILAIDDIFFIKGPLLSYVSQNHLIPALAAISMTTIAIIGVMYSAEKKRLFLAWDSMAILTVYIINLILLYMFR